jgi:hypothetical protein
MGLRVQLLMGAFGIFIIGTLTSLISSGVWFGNSEMGIINQLAGYNVINVQSLGGFGIPKGVLDWFNGICTMIAWQYPYLNNVAGLILKLCILYPVSLGVVIGIVTLFITIVQGSLSLVQSLKSYTS